MRNRYIAFLLLASALIIGVRAFAAPQAYTRDEIVQFFEEYRYTPDEADILWWSENARNEYGNLEDNLSRRFYLQFGFWLTQEESFVLDFGAAGAFRPSNFKTSLSQSLSATASTTEDVKVTAISVDGTTLTDSDVGDYVVYTINPGSGNQEKIACISGFKTSGSNVYLENCTRGLNQYNDQAATARLKTHSPGELIIISNDDAFLKNQYGGLDAYAQVMGRWDFATTTNASSTTKIIGFRFGGGGQSKDWGFEINNGESPNPYCFYDQDAGSVGAWSCSDDGTNTYRLASSTGGFTLITPLSQVSSEFKLNTSTFDFSLDGSNLRIASSTVSSGTASGNRLDDQINLRLNNTTTIPLAQKFSDGFLTATSTITRTTTTTRLNSEGEGICFSNDCYSQIRFRLATSSNATTTTTGVVTDATNATFSIPANSLGTNGYIRISISGNFTGAGAADTIEITYGGSRACFHATSAASADFHLECIITNTTATNNQIATGYGGYGTAFTNSGIKYFSVDTTTALNLLIRVTHDNAGDSHAIRQVIIETVRL